MTLVKNTPVIECFAASRYILLRKTLDDRERPQVAKEVPMHKKCIERDREMYRDDTGDLLEFNEFLFGGFAANNSDVRFGNFEVF